MIEQYLNPKTNHYLKKINVTKKAKMNNVNTILNIKKKTPQLEEVVILDQYINLD